MSWDSLGWFAITEHTKKQLPSADPYKERLPNFHHAVKQNPLSQQSPVLNPLPSTLGLHEYVSRDRETYGVAFRTIQR